jgi:hypothetical protein
MKPAKNEMGDERRHTTIASISLQYGKAQTPKLRWIARAGSAVQLVRVLTARAMELMFILKRVGIRR